MALIDGARNVLKNCLDIKKGEKLLIITDTEKEKIAEVFFESAHEMGAEVLSLMMPVMGKDGVEPPDCVARIMLDMDAIIIMTKHSMTHTAARRNANRKARIVSMPDVPAESVSSGGITANYTEIRDLIDRMKEKFLKKKEVKIVSEKGTEIVMKFTKYRWIDKDDGLCRNRGDFTTLPAGEFFAAPDEKTANGKLVIDGSFGKLLSEPITFTVKEGYVESASNGDILKAMDAYGKSGRNIAEMGIGVNKSAKLMGHPLEDNKVYGTVHIGFGDNSRYGGKIKCSYHAHGVILKPSVYVDNVLVVENGNILVEQRKK
ncbi:MAG: aminopeptidase [Thermoplasmata archaeon]|nr:aminopeptidase [Thermoplasmata archaeon]